MRLIKNFLHNINDIVLAVIIVLLAAGIIYWRMQIILDYPQQLAEQQAVYNEESPAEPAEDSSEDQTEGAVSSEAEDNSGEETADTAEQTDTGEQPQG